MIFVKDFFGNSSNDLALPPRTFFPDFFPVIPLDISYGFPPRFPLKISSKISEF